MTFRPSAAAAASRFSRVQLCDPIDGSPPGSPVPGILQARTLEWVAISTEVLFSPFSDMNHCFLALQDR